MGTNQSKKGDSGEQGKSLFFLLGTYTWNFLLGNALLGTFF